MQINEFAFKAAFPEEKNKSLSLPDCPLLWLQLGGWLCSELQLGAAVGELSGSVHCHVKHRRWH